MSCHFLLRFTIDRFLPTKENVNLVEITNVKFTNDSDSTALVGFQLKDGKFAKITYDGFVNSDKAKIYDTNYTEEHTGKLVSSLTCKIIVDDFLRNYGAGQGHEKQQRLRNCVNGKFINTKDSGFQIVSSGGRRRSSRKYKKTTNQSKSCITRRQRK
jgi:hypothetical protein